MHQTELQPVVKVVKSILSAASSLEQFFCCYEASEPSANSPPPYQPRAKAPGLPHRNT